MSLPTELIANITSHLVVANLRLEPGYSYDSVSYINVTTITFGRDAYGRRRLSPPKVARRQVLSPILAIGNKQLFDIAKAEFFRANTYRAALSANSNHQPEQGEVPERRICDDRRERSTVKHLELKVSYTGLRFRHTQPSDLSSFGEPEAKLLKGLPSADMYPNLRSLTIDLHHDIMRSERNRSPQEAAEAEVSFLTNVLSALRDAKRGYRNAQVSVHFRHEDDPLTYHARVSREPVEVNGRLLTDADLAWQVLDLPKAAVDF